MADDKKEKAKKVVAERKFKDKNTGATYQKGADITHLGEDRHNELKQRGFIKND